MYGNTHKENERSLPLARDHPVIYHGDQRFTVYADIPAWVRNAYAKRQCRELRDVI